MISSLTSFHSQQGSLLEDAAGVEVPMQIGATMHRKDSFAQQMNSAALGNKRAFTGPEEFPLNIWKIWRKKWNG